MKMPGSLTNSVAVLLMLTAIKQIWIMKTAFIIIMVEFFPWSLKLHCNSPFRISPRRPLDPSNVGDGAPCYICPYT